MKRYLTLLCTLALLLTTGCRPGADDPLTTTPPPSSQPTASSASTFYHPLTGIPTETDLSRQKPVAVMLNNLKSALPQQGNGQADIIYEVLAEGGITRMLAVYQDVSQLDLVGAVRSARMYYWELAQGHDAVYIHAGGSPEFYSTKSSLGAFTVDGVNGYYAGAGAGMFWRDQNRIKGLQYAYEHSMLTSGSAISAMLADKGLQTHREDYRYQMTFVDDGTPDNGQSASIVTVPFSTYKTGVFRYQPSTGQYLVEEYDQPYIDGNDGSQVAVTNLLILQTTCTTVDNAGRLAVDLSSGNGYFACGGKMIPITWEKGNRNDQLTYYTDDGLPLPIGRGKSYVCIIPTGRSISAQ